jgi:hypothetical protein
MAKVRIDVTLTFTTPPSVGAVGAGRTLADKVITRNARGEFIIPASQIKVLVSVMGNVATDLIRHYVGDTTPHQWMVFGGAGVGLGAVILLAHIAGVLRAEFRGPRDWRIEGTKPAASQGLVAFVSLKQREHLEKALAYHNERLKRVWLVATPEAQPLAREIREKYETATCLVDIVPLDDEWDLARAREVVEGIYRDKLGQIAEQDVIADFTGGTKPLTVGMIFACLSPSRKLQYVPAVYSGGKAVRPGDPIEYSIDYSLAGFSPHELTAETRAR